MFSLFKGKTGHSWCIFNILMQVKNSFNDKILASDDNLDYNENID
jgi:hypothetical protein